MKYKYKIIGVDSQSNTWTAEGEVGVRANGQFTSAVHLAMMDSFEKVTNGKAIYGHPGTSCKGPYKVTYLEINRVESS